MPVMTEAREVGKVASLRVRPLEGGAAFGELIDVRGDRHLDPNEATSAFMSSTAMNRTLYGRVDSGRFSPDRCDGGQQT
ncbi:MAG: hypothetical protein R3C45_06630 [Phycisphaerales bacterium]